MGAVSNGVEKAMKREAAGRVGEWLEREAYNGLPLVWDSWTNTEIDIQLVEILYPEVKSSALDRRQGGLTGLYRFRPPRYEDTASWYCHKMIAGQFNGSP